MSNTYYAKSFENDFILKRLNKKQKIPFQSIQNILKTKTIKPNTKSFGKDNRLACTFLHKNYLKTYRAQGLIFQTEESPDFIYPCDLLLLTDAKKIIVQYYRIKNKLHIYYNHNLINGFEKFVFKDIKELLKKFPTQKKLWEEINNFRKDSGFSYLPKAKHRLIEYNEVIFHKPIQIKPIAIFGYKKLAKEIAKEHNLKYYKTAKEFYNSF